MVLIVYGALLLAGVLGLLLVPMIVPLLARWRYSRWIATLADGCSSRSARAEEPRDPAALDASSTRSPSSSSGRSDGRRASCCRSPTRRSCSRSWSAWRWSRSRSAAGACAELAVISLLGHHGVAPEKALLFSVCFGLALAVGSLPGALAWLLYPFAPSARSAERGG